MKRILNTPQMWIDGKCFKIQKFQKKSKIVKNEIASKMQDNLINVENAQQSMTDLILYQSQLKYEYNIIVNDEGKFFTSFHLPFPYCKKLATFPHLDIKTLSESTKTVISIPTIETETNLVITGDNEEDITEARNNIHSIISEIRNQFRAMQFVCIPTISEEIAANFQKFKAEILGGEKIPGMEASIFQKAQKLHLTIAVFALLGDNEKNEACKTLQDYKTTILDPILEKTGPLKIHVSGLECMNSNMQRVNVLYANAKIVDETEEHNLQKIVNDLSNYFYERGLLKEYQDNVKLHMTLINTKYRKPADKFKKKKWAMKQSFDATKIMEKYKNYDFGVCHLHSIRLCLISSSGDDGFYKIISAVTL